MRYFFLVALIATTLNPAPAEAQISREVIFELNSEFNTGSHVLLPEQVNELTNQWAPLLRGYLRNEQLSNECTLYLWGATNNELNRVKSVGSLANHSKEASNEYQLDMARAASVSWYLVRQLELPGRMFHLQAMSGEYRKTVLLELVCFETPREGNSEAVMAEIEKLGLQVDNIETRTTDLENRMNDVEDHLYKLEEEGRNAPLISSPTEQLLVDPTWSPNGFQAGLGLGYIGVPHLEVRASTPVGLFVFGGFGLESEEVFIECVGETCNNSGNALMRSYTFGGGFTLPFEGLDLTFALGGQYRHCDSARDLSSFWDLGVVVPIVARASLYGGVRGRYDVRTKKFNLGVTVGILFRF